MLAITGATGQLGKLLVPHLLKTLPPSALAISTRDPSSDTASQFASQGVRVRKGDFADGASLEHAFEGCDRLLLVSANKVGDEAVALHTAAIDAAKAAGVRKIFYTSQMAAGPDSVVAFGQDHYRTEQYLEKSGLEFTSLRNGFYMTSCKYMIGGAEHTGAIAAPKDGKVAWTSHEDLAEGIAKLILADMDGKPADKYVYLTNTKTWDMDDVAGMLSHILHKETKRVVVEPEAYVHTLTQHGLPEGMARMFLGMWQGSEKGEFDRVDPTLETLLGREPLSLEAGLQNLYKA